MVDTDYDELAQAGFEAGEWWAARKATDDELARLSAWAAAVLSEDIDPFDVEEHLMGAYGPAEMVYFALSPEAGYGDRSAARWFWAVMPGWKKFGERTGEIRYVRGFVAGAVGCEVE